MADPLHQFQIEPLLPISVGGANLSFTNSSLWMAIAVGCAYLLVMAGTRQSAMVPGRLQAAVEMPPHWPHPPRGPRRACDGVAASSPPGPGPRHRP